MLALTYGITLWGFKCKRIIKLNIKKLFESVLMGFEKYKKFKKSELGRANE